MATAALPGEDYGRIDGAAISVLEDPSIAITITR